MIYLQLMRSGDREIKSTENHVLASPQRVSHPEGHFLQGIPNAIRKPNQGKMDHVIESIIHMLASGPVRAQRNDRDVERRKIQKELLHGGFRSQKLVFRKGFNRRVK